MVKDETYAFSFDALTSPATAAGVKIVIQGGPDISYAEFLPAKKGSADPRRAALRLHLHL